MILLLLSVSMFAQKNAAADIDKAVSQSEAEAHVHFLAADEMRGRDTGSPELDIAANYIAAHFRRWGLKPMGNGNNYFQPVSLIRVKPATEAKLTIGNDVLTYKDNFLIINGGAFSFTGEFVYVGYGSDEEIPKAVEGKMVVALAGTKEDNSPMKLFTAGGGKLKRIKAMGGVGLLEVLGSAPFPWPALVNYFGNNERMTISTDSVVTPHLIMKDSEGNGFKALKENNTQGTLSITAPKPVKVYSRNVVAMVEGANSKLRSEYVVVSAHYDHVGVSKTASGDSIFNGARDNALGTAAMLAAAKYFSQNPPKRSVIFMALTAEERGLLGSNWYVEHPLVPLNQTVFNLNTDGAGYNDSGVVTVIGLDKVAAEGDLQKASGGFGLKAVNDPVPEQGLYERSDNYHFASKGIPALNIAPGIKAFDAELMKYYHQPADEVESLDFTYVTKYIKTVVYATQLISNSGQVPGWIAGSKYAAIGKVLYGK